MSSKSCSYHSALIIVRNSFLGFIIGALFLSACSKYKENDQIPRFSVDLKTNAENGNPKQQCELAQCYMFGLGVEKNEKEAFRWFLKAAEQGDEIGIRNTARCYIFGRGVERDETQGAKLLHRLNVKKHLDALAHLEKHEMYESIIPIEIVHLQTRSFENEHAEELRNSIYVYKNKDPQELVSSMYRCIYWCEMLVRQGKNIEAVNLIGANPANSQINSFTKRRIIENLRQAQEMGILNPDGLAKLRQGSPPVITKGDYISQLAMFDQIISNELCPELNDKPYNYRLCPASLESRKADKMGEEYLKYAEELHSCGLLSAKGLQAVKKAYEK